jgi:hypothetical protein
VGARLGDRSSSESATTCPSTPLAKAIGEIGRVVRTITMLDYVTDEENSDASLQPANPFFVPLLRLPQIRPVICSTNASASLNAR